MFKYWNKQMNSWGPDNDAFVIHNLFNNCSVQGCAKNTCEIRNKNTQMQTKIPIQPTKYKHPWPPLCRRRFKMHFLERKLLISNKIPMKYFPCGPYWQYTHIGSGNGLATSKRQDITWTNERLFQGRFMGYIFRRQNAISGSSRGNAEGTQQNARACYTGYISRYYSDKATLYTTYMLI